MRRRGRPKHPDILTPREWEVLALLRDRLANPEIAERLGITRDAVKYHVSEILSKLGVSSREEAALWHPSERPWWAAWPIWAKIAGVATMAAAVAGLAVLGWAVIATKGSREPGSAETLNTVPPVDSDFPIVFSGPGKEGSAFDIYAVSADGSGLTDVVADPDAEDTLPAWSPDRSRIAYYSFQREPVTPSPDDPKGTTAVVNRYLYVTNADGSNKTRLTKAPELENNIPPVWSPDGARLAFESELGGQPGVYVINADGSGLYKLINRPGEGPTWSPDGARIAFASAGNGGQEDIYVVAVDGSDPVRLTTAGGFNPAWSPDGVLIAFVSARDGNFEIYVMRSDGASQTNISRNAAPDFSGAPVGHHPPAWSPDSTRVAFLSDRDGNTQVYTAPVDGSSITRVTRDGRNHQLPEWSPGGTYIVSWADGPYLTAANGQGEPQRIIQWPMGG